MLGAMTDMNSPKPIAIRPIVLVALLAVPILALTHCSTPVLRFADPQANVLALGILLLLPPLTALGLSLQLARHSAPGASVFIVVSLVVLAVSLVLAGFVALHGLFVLRDRGVDQSFLPLSSTPAGHGALVVYQTNGGATTSFGIVVRHELPLPLGLKLVRDVCDGYPADSASVTPVGHGHYVVTVHTYKGAPPVICNVYPKRLVFF